MNLLFTIDQQTQDPKLSFKPPSVVYSLQACPPRLGQGVQQGSSFSSETISPFSKNFHYKNKKNASLFPDC